ncbi:THAP domain-containing protein 6-like isoform X1 [Pimephales promelas]|uniref:THAP domain-containing protein 6-like isoform X1 n=1 Tax=Pimephales promelas TaxID=90988 RepID=UPI0019558090|nr:THAP domain-containing protein 6-like isoform X1 [Pimephales promelas]XP_039525107.1 THAP domain-containing protein 6-like isoform X1 [Pimephales promelas]
MPSSCAAWGCTNRRTIENRSRGITFHKFPKDKEVRRQWEVATRRQGFSASDFSVLCSEHFESDHFDRTGQTVRIRDGAKPSVFSFPPHLQKPVATRTTQASKKAEKSLLVNSSQHFQETDPPLPNPDHTYALPASPTSLKARLCEALARVESLEREKRNVKDRERRAKSTVRDVLEDLKGKNLINEDLKERLNFYSVTGERVFVMMDACHMLKLARNMLQAYSPITSSTGQINWTFIAHLNEVQVKDGLHAAHKVPVCHGVQHQYRHPNVDDS